MRSRLVKECPSKKNKDHILEWSKNKDHEEYSECKKKDGLDLSKSSEIPISTHIKRHIPIERAVVLIQLNLEWLCSIKFRGRQNWSLRQQNDGLDGPRVRRHGLRWQPWHGPGGRHASRTAIVNTRATSSCQKETGRAVEKMGTTRAGMEDAQWRTASSGQNRADHLRAQRHAARGRRQERPRRR